MSRSILAQVRALAAELGGYVGGSQAGTLDQAASVTLRVPAERFDELLTRLQELTDVEVVSMSTREEDVTGQVVDLAARIRNLEASEASYRVLFDRAERIEDILTVQGRLDEVRGQIEQLEAQLHDRRGPGRALDADGDDHPSGRAGRRRAGRLGSRRPGGDRGRDPGRAGTGSLQRAHVGRDRDPADRAGDRADHDCRDAGASRAAPTRDAGEPEASGEPPAG